MESQLLNSLFTNLIGLGRQLFPQGDAGLSSEGQNAFFDILAQKMGGTVNMSLSSMPAGVAADNGKAAGGEAEDVCSCPVAAASQDPEEISILVSSLIAAIGQPVVTDNTADVEEVDPEAIADFLRGVLEVLSGGDEVELKSAEDTNAKPTQSGEGCEDKDMEGANRCMGCLASVLLQLEGRTGKSGTADASSAGKDAVPVEQPEKPDWSAIKTEAPKGPAQTGVSEDQEAPAFVVEVVRAAKKAVVPDPSMKKEMGTQAAAPAAETPAAAKDDRAILASRPTAALKDTTEPDKIVIRVKETMDTEIGEERDSGDNPVIQQNDSSRHGTRQAAPETKGVVKNDFGAMMVEKIEKLTEQFAGRSMNMDMTVRLKIDDNETVLVGLRDEGSSVTVEVKTTSETTMNFLQSQKEDIARVLENRNIQTTIHVDIDQDAQGKRQQKQHQDAEENETAEQQDFGSFFETLA